MRLYLDTAIVIYLIERVAPYVAAIDARLDSPDIQLATSELTRMECRVKPLRDGDTHLLRDYDDFFGCAAISILPLSRQVIDTATLIRAQHGFRTPDSIRLAAAIATNCDVFLTNDRRLRRFEDITVEIIQR